MFKLVVLPILLWPAQGFLHNSITRLPARDLWNLHERRAESPDEPMEMGNNKIVRPINEFSRTISTDKIIITKREYTMQVTASVDEMINLATRFSLPNITSLHADLVITRAVDRQDGSYSNRQLNRDTANLASCVQIEGTVKSSCYQTCVRTNENFSVDKDFPLFAIIRPCSSVPPTRTCENKPATKQPKKGRQKKDALMQQQFNLATSGGNRIDEQDFYDQDIIEDEAILGDNGILDVGELVAQMFRLKLDPYPKKMGTQPVSYSITG